MWDKCEWPVTERPILNIIGNHEQMLHSSVNIMVQKLFYGIKFALERVCMSGFYNVWEGRRVNYTSASTKVQASQLCCASSPMTAKKLFGPIPKVYTCSKYLQELQEVPYWHESFSSDICR